MKLHAERSCSRALAILFCIFQSLFFSACESMYFAGLPQGDPAIGYGITGYVASSPGSVAPGEVVTLLDTKSGMTVGNFQTDAVGKFTFYPVKPGSYQLNVRSSKLPVLVTNNHVRLDVDLSSPDGRMNYMSAGTKQNSIDRSRGTAPREYADGGTAGMGLATAGAAGGADGQLRQLLLSSAWCSFSFSKSAGVTKAGRAQFFPNGTYTLKRGSEGYYSGSGGTYASQDKTGGDGRWQVRGGQLFLSEGRGPLEPVNLKIKYNSNGSPILIVEGVEYCQCN